MKLTCSAGEYIREARNSFEEIEWLHTVMEDWPSGGWDLNRCMSSISKSSKQTRYPLEIGKSYGNVCCVYCLPDETRVGAFNLHYEVAGDKSSLRIDWMAFHPDFRGQRRYKSFAKALTWLAHNHLNVDSMHYDAIESAVPVKNYAETLGGEITGTKDSEFAKQKIYKLDIRRENFSTILDEGEEMNYSFMP